MYSVPYKGHGCSITEELNYSHTSRGGCSLLHLNNESYQTVHINISLSRSILHLCVTCRLNNWLHTSWSSTPWDMAACRRIIAGLPSTTLGTSLIFNGRVRRTTRWASINNVPERLQQGVRTDFVVVHYTQLRLTFVVTSGILGV